MVQALSVPPVPRPGHDIQTMSAEAAMALT